MKKRKAKVASKSKLLKNFKDRFVTISIKDVKSRSAVGRTTNLAFIGYLTDEDEENLFLSQEQGGQVYAAIPKTQNAGIIATDEVEFLMENIQLPEGSEVQ